MSDSPSEMKIIVNNNASLRVEGGVPLFDHQGNRIQTPEGRPFYSLCRCGQSSRKPFCDGAHNRCDFDGTLAAQS